MKFKQLLHAETVNAGDAPAHMAHEIFTSHGFNHRTSATGRWVWSDREGTHTSVALNRDMKSAGWSRATTIDAHIFSHPQSRHQIIYTGDAAYTEPRR